MNVGVVGLDLSLRGAAAVYVPSSWEGVRHWGAIERMTIGYEGGDDERKAARLHDIAESITQFVSCNRARYVYVEDYAYGLGAKSGMKLAELGGAVKARLYERSNVVAVPLNVTTARCYLLGKIPRGKGAAVKRLAEVMRDMDLPSTWTADERDAWVIANAARAELGMVGITLAA